MNKPYILTEESMPQDFKIFVYSSDTSPFLYIRRNSLAGGYGQWNIHDQSEAEDVKKAIKEIEKVPQKALLYVRHESLALRRLVKLILSGYELINKIQE